MDIVTYALCKKNDAAIIDMIESMEKLTMVVADEVPTVAEAEPNVLYLVDTNGDNVYEEYVLATISGTPQILSLGNIVDFSNFYTKSEVDTALGNKQDTLVWDSVPTEDSTNDINSGAVYTALSGISTTIANLDFVKNVTISNNVLTITYHNNSTSTLSLTIDNAPTQNSTNPVSSGGVYTAIDGLQKELTQQQYDALTPAQKNNGTVYFITDANAGENYLRMIGTTTTAISNGSTTNPITIDGESYTAVFGDIVVYNYTEFVFDGTTWSEFGRPFDTTPTSGSANAVTSDGIYKVTPFARGVGDNSAYKGNSTASGAHSMASGYGASATGTSSHAFGSGAQATQGGMCAIGTYNAPRTGDLFNIGKGSDINTRSNIVEVNSTSMNINGDIQKNGISLPTPYRTMPTITAAMLGQIAQYVGTTGGGFTQGYFYIASSDGQTEPTYSWVHLATQDGYSETVLWENDGTTAPNTITLSSAYTNFDAICVTCFTSANLYSSVMFLTSSLTLNNGYRFYWNYNEYIEYILSTATTFTLNNVNAGMYPVKIIGIKYGSGERQTQQNGYSETVIWENDDPSTKPSVGDELFTLDDLSNYDVLYCYYSLYNATLQENTDYVNQCLTSQFGKGWNVFFILNNNIFRAQFAKGSTSIELTNIDKQTIQDSGYTYYVTITKIVGVKYDSNGGGSTDDYSTTERLIGKWIDGSDLYQRTFEVTGLTNNGVWNSRILGTSNIDIVDWVGYFEYEDGNHEKQRYPLSYKTGDYSGCVITSISDLSVQTKITTLTLLKAVITIKYTKTAVQANVETRNEPTVEEPVEDDIR